MTSPSDIARRAVTSWPWLEAVPLVLAILAGARQEISIRTDAKISTQLDVSPKGVSAPDFSDRDSASLATIADRYDDADLADHVEEFVTSTLGQFDRDELLRVAEDFGATGWTWIADADPCDYCRDRDGQTFDISVPFRDHPHCGCRPGDLIFDAGYTDQAEEEAMQDA